MVTIQNRKLKKEQEQEQLAKEKAAWRKKYPNRPHKDFIKFIDKKTLREFEARHRK